MSMTFKVEKPKMESPNSLLTKSIEAGKRKRAGLDHERLVLTRVTMSHSTSADLDADLQGRL